MAETGSSNNNIIYNITGDTWIRPWDMPAASFDDLYNRDDRFFAVVIKGMLSWLNRNIHMYGKEINHFIFNTGSSYLYMENANGNIGYNYGMCSVSGEDQIYMQLPRCLVTMTSFELPTDELTSPYARGVYERRSGNEMKGYSAEMRRMPVNLSVTLEYVLSNFNETIILMQELIDKLAFQRYYKVTYLGQTLQCSIEFPASLSPEINKIDLESSEPTQKTITMDVNICTNYPVINTRSEVSSSTIINSWKGSVDMTAGDMTHGDYSVTDSADYEVD